MKPFVSCLCPTYGRTGLLEESIESFLMQDYDGPMELVVVNDLPQQILRCDAPGVRVFNAPQRCDNLGQKRNLAAKYAAGDLLMTWSDDDIHLPNRISANVREWRRDHYVTEGSHFFLCKSERSYKKGRLTGPFLMAREGFWELGGIPDAFTGEDAAFLQKVRAKLQIVESKEASYIYRWGVTERFHASWFDKQGRNGWDEIQKRVDATLREGIEPTGIIHLKPHWKEDYEQLRELLCANSR